MARASRFTATCRWTPPSGRSAYAISNSNRAKLNRRRYSSRRRTGIGPCWTRSSRPARRRRSSALPSTSHLQQRRSRAERSRTGKKRPRSICTSGLRFFCCSLFNTGYRQIGQTDGHPKAPVSPFRQISAALTELGSGGLISAQTQLPAHHHRMHARSANRCAELARDTVGNAFLHRVVDNIRRLYHLARDVIGIAEAVREP